MPEQFWKTLDPGEKYYDYRDASALTQAYEIRHIGCLVRTIFADPHDNTCSTSSMVLVPGAMLVETRVVDREQLYKLEASGNYAGTPRS